MAVHPAALEASTAPERARRSVVALVVLAAVVPRLATAGTFQVVDETLWMNRTVGFGDAILRGDLASASATTDGLATMPGVTTMWLGTLARGLWALGGGLGLSEGGAAFTASLPAIHLAQAVVAVTTSLLVGLFVALAYRWAGPVPAVVAGALLATEPFLVAHGSVLHTDELTALFGATGTVALLLALGIPGPAAVRPARMAVLAGALLGAAALTKVSALVLAPGIALVVLGAAVSSRRWSRRRVPPLDDLGAAARTLALAAAVAVGVVVVAWPALWVSPLHQLSLLRDSAGMAVTDHRTFFLGEVTSTPGPWFYAVATPLRMTPWFFVGTLALVPLAFWRGRRAHAGVLVLLALPALLVLSTASKQFDRYVIVVLPALALLVGLGAEVVVGAARARTAGWRPAHPVVGALVAAGLAGHALAVAPWGMAYFNPLLGGSETAERAVLVGWGEGQELASDVIAAREGPACDVDVLPTYGVPSSVRCGRIATNPHEADYAVVYVNHVQRIAAAQPWVRGLRATATRVATVRVRGIDYAEVYDLRQGWSAEEPAAG